MGAFAKFRMKNSILIVLGSKIQHLATDGQHTLENDPSEPGLQDELLDALDDLRAEIAGPANWLGAFLARQKFAALQRAAALQYIRSRIC